MSRAPVRRLAVAVATLLLALLAAPGPVGAAVEPDPPIYQGCTTVDAGYWAYGTYWRDTDPPDQPGGGWVGPFEDAQVKLCIQRQSSVHWATAVISTDACCFGTYNKIDVRVRVTLEACTSSGYVAVNQAEADSGSGFWTGYKVNGRYLFPTVSSPKSAYVANCYRVRAHVWGARITDQGAGAEMAMSDCGLAGICQNDWRSAWKNP